MNRLHVSLAAPDLARLEAWARRRGVTKSEAVRVAVRALVRPSSDDPVLGLSGMVDLGPADLSDRLDHYLE
jgi:Ribbon-helix-helix protein, copG family